MIVKDCALCEKEMTNLSGIHSVELWNIRDNNMQPRFVRITVFACSKCVEKHDLHVVGSMR